MSIQINGHDVSFHDAHHAEIFLTHGDNHHAAQGYFNEAKDHGKAYMYANSHKYEIRHIPGENGKKDSFSVHYAG